MSIPRNTPQAVQDVPVLQWANGHTKARSIGEKRFQPLIGFHAEAGKDAQFDDACRDAAMAQIEIQHQRAGGSEIKLHWSLGESLRFWPVTSGPPFQTLSGCLRSPATAAAGIGLAWPQGEKSKLAVRGFIAVGQAACLVQLSVRSTMTEYLLAALLDHYRVCAVADEMIDRNRHPELVMFHELALPLGAGAEVAAGKGETAQITPFVTTHPQEIDRAYIKSCWRNEAVHRGALAAWEATVAWASGYASGETNGDSYLDRV